MLSNGHLDESASDTREGYLTAGAGEALIPLWRSKRLVTGISALVDVEVYPLVMGLGPWSLLSTPTRGRMMARKRLMIGDGTGYASVYMHQFVALVVMRGQTTALEATRSGRAWYDELGDFPHVSVKNREFLDCRSSNLVVGGVSVRLMRKDAET